MKKRYQILILMVVIIATPFVFIILNRVYEKEEVIWFFATIFIEIFLMALLIIKSAIAIQSVIYEHPGEE